MINRSPHLLERLSEGDPYAFEQIFKAYHPQLVNYFQVFVGNREVARDMAQDIFLSIWKQRRTFLRVESVSAYIFKMARHAVCNYYDHLSVCKKFEMEKKNGSCSEADGSPDEILFAKNLEKFIHESLSKLPPKRRRIFLLSRLEGLDNEQIADKLNIDKRTVQNQISLCLGHLKKILLVLIIVSLPF